MVFKQFFQRAFIEIQLAEHTNLYQKWELYSDVNGWHIRFDVLIDMLYETKDSPHDFQVAILPYDWWEWVDFCIHFLIEEM